MRVWDLFLQGSLSVVGVGKVINRHSCAVSADAALSTCNAFQISATTLDYTEETLSTSAIKASSTNIEAEVNTHSTEDPTAQRLLTR